MKFLVTKELIDNKLLSMIVTVLVGFLGLFLLSDLILKHLQIGLTFVTAKETLIGNPSEFIEPILFDVLLERIHISLFISMLILFLLSTVYIRVLNKEKSVVIHVTFIAAILSPIFLSLGYAYGTVFIVAWIGSCVLWHLCGLCLSMRILMGLLNK